ncbi:MAG: TonB-dependent receptor [Bacteroidaceae bacterium]|nr:TonB-dependent receptor [Bacteroidaceae bacterium]
MKKLVMSLSFALLLPMAALAQSGGVKGRVLNEAGEPVSGVVVRVNGTNATVLTDANGNYQLPSAKAGDELTYSCLGMKSQTVKVGQGNVDVTLKEDVLDLESAVVVGYGTTKSKDLTAFIETVKAEKLANIPSNTPMAALQGKVAGLNIVNSGVPGAGPTVTIRGLGSFGSTTPLYVVDGMFYDNINFLNNADIEEIAVLKDASAAAIYGVRAANGVVIITTKKGKKNEKAKVTYEGYVGVQSASNVLKMANSSQYAQMLRETGITAYDENLKKSVELYGGDFENNVYGSNTNWYDELTRSAFMTNHALNITGGTERASYGVGMSYLYQNGILKSDNEYSRMNFRGNLDYQATNWLNVGMNAVFSRNFWQLPNNAAWQQAFNMPGIFPVYDASTADQYTDGYTSPNTLGFTSNFYNPVATAKLYDAQNRSYQVMSNFYADFQILPEKLSFRTSYSYDYTGLRATTFRPAYDIGTNQKNATTSLTKSTTIFNNYIWDNTLTYKDSWGGHNLTAMVGSSMRQTRYDWLSGTAQNVPEGKDAWKYLSLGDKAGITLGDNGYRYRGLSYFGRLQYNWKHRYLLTVTFRADGSSKYNDKWGYFPSVGAAWVVTDEPFMEKVRFIDYLKLRASWGKLGNDRGSASAGTATVTNYRSVFGTNTAFDGYVNNNTFSWLGWEIVNETNLGFSLATLQSRLKVDFDFYNRMTEDAIVAPLLPMRNVSVAGNWGKILNRGVDLTIAWNDRVGKDFSYQIGANFSFLHNEVRSLRDGVKMIKGGKTVQMVGEKMNSYYGLKVIGVYQTQEQVDADPIAVANNLVPGDFIYEDVNGDGKIDAMDKQILGSYVPDLTYGFNVGLQWKGLDFSISFYGQAGGELWNRKRALRYASQSYNFDYAQYKDRWTGPGSTNSNPSAAALMKSWNIGDSNNASYFVESSDYFRIQNINIGYTFENLRIGNYTLPRLRLSATADRPWTTFKAHSFTPELSDPEGWDTQVYPLTSTYTFGVQITF